MCCVVVSGGLSFSKSLRYRKFVCLSARIRLKNTCPNLTKFSLIGQAETKQIQSHSFKWIALGPDYEYPLRGSTYPCFILYIVSKQDQTNDIHFSGLSAQVLKLSVGAAGIRYVIVIIVINA